MEYKKKYPLLRSLFCAYFNQDWDCDYNSPEAVIRGFITDGGKEGKEAVQQAIDELKMLLKEEHTQEEWESILYDSFGCAYYFDYEEQYTPREWLEKVLKQLEEEIDLADEA